MIGCMLFEYYGCIYLVFYDQMFIDEFGDNIVWEEFLGWLICWYLYGRKI